jgi:hypothetical protein
MSNIHAIAASPDAPSAAQGEAVSEAELRAARRARRLESLERVRLAAEEMALHLADGVAGRLPEDAQEVFAKIRDPHLAFSRAERAVRRLAALEDRLDEDAETRAARIAAERAAQAAADARAAALRAEDAARAPERAKKHAIRRAMRRVLRDADPETEYLDREVLLNDLFDDYESYDNYAGDTAEIVAKLCSALNLVPLCGGDRFASPDEDDDGDDDNDDGGDNDGDENPPPPETVRARALTLARAYLNETPPRDADPGG